MNTIAVFNRLSSLISKKLFCSLFSCVNNRPLRRGRLRRLGELADASSIDQFTAGRERRSVFEIKKKLLAIFLLFWTRCVHASPGHTKCAKQCAAPLAHIAPPR